MKLSRSETISQETMNETDEGPLPPISSFAEMFQRSPDVSQEAAKCTSQLLERKTIVVIIRVHEQEGSNQ